MLDRTRFTSGRTDTSTDTVNEFIADHALTFVVEQNRDGQLRTLLINEGQIDPGKLPTYEGTRVTYLEFDGGHEVPDQIATSAAAWMVRCAPMAEWHR